MNQNFFVNILFVFLASGIVQASHNPKSKESLQDIIKRNNDSLRHTSGWITELMRDENEKYITPIMRDSNIPRMIKLQSQAYKIQSDIIACESTKYHIKSAYLLTLKFIDVNKQVVGLRNSIIKEYIKRQLIWEMAPSSSQTKKIHKFVDEKLYKQLIKPKKVHINIQNLVALIKLDGF